MHSPTRAAAAAKAAACETAQRRSCAGERAAVHCIMQQAREVAMSRRHGYPWRRPQARRGERAPPLAPRHAGVAVSARATVPTARCSVREALPTGVAPSRQEHAGACCCIGIASRTSRAVSARFKGIARTSRTMSCCLPSRCAPPAAARGGEARLKTVRYNSYYLCYVELRSK